MNGQVRQDRLDDLIWNDVRTLLSDPQRLVRELERRRTSGSGDATGEQQAKLRSAAGKVQRGIARLIDAYGEGLLNKTEFEPRITAAKDQLAKLQGELQSRIDQEVQTQELRLVIGNLEAFAKQVTAGLESIDWNAKRDVIRALVKRVEIEKEQVKVVYRVDTSPFEPCPNRGILHYCWRRGLAPAGQYLSASCVRPVDGRGLPWLPVRAVCG